MERNLRAARSVRARAPALPVNDDFNSKLTGTVKLSIPFSEVLVIACALTAFSNTNSTVFVTPKSGGAQSYVHAFTCVLSVCDRSCASLRARRDCHDRPTPASGGYNACHQSQ